MRYGECDPQGIVFNANYLLYFDVAFTELWRITDRLATGSGCGNDDLIRVLKRAVRRNRKKDA